jgi:protein-tyrosine phosphatase
MAGRCSGITPADWPLIRIRDGLGGTSIGSRCCLITNAANRSPALPLDGRARQFRVADFDRFDVILAMARENRSHLTWMARNESDRGKVHLMREFDSQASDSPDVPDPYDGGEQAFEEVYQMLDRSTRGLLDTLSKT